MLWGGILFFCVIVSLKLSMNASSFSVMPAWRTSVVSEFLYFDRVSKLTSSPVVVGSALVASLLVSLLTTLDMFLFLFLSSGTRSSSRIFAASACSSVEPDARRASTLLSPAPTGAVLTATLACSAYVPALLTSFFSSFFGCSCIFF